jgi:zinc transporter ZupT
MIAAAFSLVYEGTTFAEDIIDTNNANFIYSLSPILRTLLGFLFGIAFILSTKKMLTKYEHVKLGDVDSINAKKMVLIVFVMTLHSLTEGVGIGVSFGGKGGNHLGQFISLSLAVHNIPEGLAIALVLTSRKVSNLRAGLWAIFTSLPQPLMAVPSFIFVDHFIPMFPIGLGFASGAMANVAIFELLVEAVEDTSYLTTGIVSILSFCLMILIQESVKVAI